VFTIINAWFITYCLVLFNCTCFNMLPYKSKDNGHPTAPSSCDCDSNGQSEYWKRGGHNPPLQNDRELVEEWLEGGISLQQINTNYGQFRMQWSELRRLFSSYIFETSIFILHEEFERNRSAFHGMKMWGIHFWYWQKKNLKQTHSDFITGKVEGIYIIQLLFLHKLTGEHGLLSWKLSMNNEC